MCAIVLLLSCCSDCRSSYVEMMTFLNWVPPPQEEKALAAMEVAVVGMVTSSQSQQAEHTPATSIHIHTHRKTQTNNKVRLEALHTILSIGTSTANDTMAMAYL